MTVVSRTEPAGASDALREVAGCSMSVPSSGSWEDRKARIQGCPHVVENPEVVRPCHPWPVPPLSRTRRRLN